MQKQRITLVSVYLSNILHISWKYSIPDYPFLQLSIRVTKTDVARTNRIDSTLTETKSTSLQIRLCSKKQCK